MAVPGPGVLGQLRGAELIWGISAQADPPRVPRTHPYPPSSLHVLQLSPVFQTLWIPHWAQRSWVERSQPLSCEFVPPTQARFPVLQPMILTNISPQVTALPLPAGTHPAAWLQKGTWDWLHLRSPAAPQGSWITSAVYLVRFFSPGFCYSSGLCEYCLEQTKSKYLMQ